MPLAVSRHPRWPIEGSHAVRRATSEGIATRPCFPDSDGPTEEFPMRMARPGTATLLALALIALAASAPAQDYPTRPITLLVPQAPGASSDLLARTLGERLQALWGQSVV